MNSKSSSKSRRKNSRNRWHSPRQHPNNSNKPHRSSFSPCNNQPEVKQEPHEAAESKQPTVPVATPARSNLPPPAVADKLVHDMLNRTKTQDQLAQTPQAPGKPEPAQPPQSKMAVDAEPRKAKKGRDPVRHARKQKFYRSLESQTLNKNTHDFTNGSVIPCPTMQLYGHAFWCIMCIVCCVCNLFLDQKNYKDGNYIVFCAGLPRPEFTSSCEGTCPACP